MKTILIIDDNQDILNAIQQGLRMYLKDCSIVTAPNGKIAGEIMRNGQVDLVLTDLDMPVMDGYQFIEQSRREHGTVPVCVMTGQCIGDEEERLKALGVSRVIGKPLEFERLANAIAEELGLQGHDAVQPGSGAPENING
jgi:CheY-like chemotaxis protein